jgi:hypothetical protein
MVQRREKEKDLRYIQEASAPAAVTVYQTYNIMYICNRYCMIGLCLLMAGDEFRMAGGESRMTGDCYPPEGSIHRCVRTHSYLYFHIYVALWPS